MDRPPIPPPPERRTPVTFRGRQRKPRQRLTARAIEAGVLDPVAITRPRWVVRYFDPYFGEEKTLDYFGANRQYAVHTARSISHHRRLIAVVESIPPQGEPP